MSAAIVCKPTKWFLLRAIAISLLFGIFAVLFFLDGSTGYRNKNLVFYYHQAFEQAIRDFAQRQGGGAEQWREFVSQQELKLPDDRSVLPAGTPERISWPDMLADYDKMKANMDSWETGLFEPFREQAKLGAKLPDQAFTAKKIFEQWVVFWICLALTMAALFVLLRTLRRSMKIEGETLYPSDGGSVKLSDLVRLDMRNWKRKGLAYAWAKEDGGKERRIRIDGLTYGGFKEEEGQPAERLMDAIKAGFSGELIDYEESALTEEGRREEAEDGAADKDLLAAGTENTGDDKE